MTLFLLLLTLLPSMALSEGNSTPRPATEFLPGTPSPAAASPTTAGLIVFSQAQSVHMANFKKIADDCRVFEQSYTSCIDHISENDFTELTVNECVGPDFAYVANDIDYERRKIISRADAQIRGIMLEACYKVAGLDTQMSGSCDLVEQDVLDILWAEYNFYSLLDMNKEKYLFEFASLPEPIFNNILGQFKILYADLDELLTEIDNHRDLTLVRLKNVIDNKTKLIVHKAATRADAPLPKIRTQTIKIEETMTDPNAFNLDKLPRPIVQDATRRMYVTPDNAYVKEALQANPYMKTRTTGFAPNRPVHMVIGNAAGTLRVDSTRKLGPYGKVIKV